MKMRRAQYSLRTKPDIWRSQLGGVTRAMMQDSTTQSGWMACEHMKSSALRQSYRRQSDDIPSGRRRPIGPDSSGTFHCSIHLTPRHSEDLLGPLRDISNFTVCVSERKNSSTENEVSVWLNYLKVSRPKLESFFTPVFMFSKSKAQKACRRMQSPWSEHRQPLVSLHKGFHFPFRCLQHLATNYAIETFDGQFQYCTSFDRIRNWKSLRYL